MFYKRFRTCEMRTKVLCKRGVALDKKRKRYVPVGFWDKSVNIEHANVSGRLCNKSVNHEKSVSVVKYVINRL